MVPTVIDADRDAARAIHRRTLGGYVVLPNYRNYWKAAGYEDEMVAIETALAAGDREAVTAAMSDAWIDDCTISGGPDEVRAQLDAWFDLGVTPIAVMSSTGGGQLHAIGELFATVRLTCDNGPRRRPRHPLPSCVMKKLVLPLAAVLALAACGGDDEESTGTEAATRRPPEAAADTHGRGAPPTPPRRGRRRPRAAAATTEAATETTDAAAATTEAAAETTGSRDAETTTGDDHGRHDGRQRRPRRHDRPGHLRTRQRRVVRDRAC